MQELDQFKTYVSILTESLEKKDVILETLLTLTEGQKAELSKEPELDMDELDSFIAKKAEKLRELDRLDQGFELIYDKVRNDFEQYKSELKQEIKRMQQLISRITDKSVKLQSLEQENKRKLEMFLSQKRGQIKNFKISNKTAANYYKSMSGHSEGNTYFLDKRK